MSVHRFVIMKAYELFFLDFFFFNDTATTEIYTLSLHDALPIWPDTDDGPLARRTGVTTGVDGRRSEEHTSELQSRFDIVCRLLLEKKKKNHPQTPTKNKKKYKHHTQKQDS